MGRNKYGGRRYARSASKYTVYNVNEVTTLMEFLMKKMDGISRGKVKSMLTHGTILVDDEIITQYDHPLRPGMKVMQTRYKITHKFHHPMMRLVYEDAYMFVVDKAEGLLSANVVGSRERSAQNVLGDYLKAMNRRDSRVRVVHRLDRCTSGLMIFAKDDKTQHTFRDNWVEIVPDRRYVAVVEGDVKDDAGSVTSYLTDHREIVTSSLEDDGGRIAITHYKVLKRMKGLSLLELKLDTGRKHQIRVQMASIGHPVMGDRKYGAEKDILGRVALHGRTIKFFHPVTGKLMEYETPIPEPFMSLFK